MATETSVVFPEIKQFTSLVSLLTGKRAAGAPTPASPVKGAATRPPMLALYAIDTDLTTPIAAMVADWNFAVMAAGLLSGIPPKVIADNIKGAALDDVTRANIYEVFNIAASLLNADGAPHVKLMSLTEFKTPTSPELTPLLTNCQRLDVNITIEGFNPGKVVIIRRS